MTNELRIALVAVALLAACDEGTPGWATGLGGHRRGDQVVATINGAPITASELAQTMAAASRGDTPHGGAPAAVAPTRDKVLATMIDQELAAQRAVALGLDQDRGYREELARLEAQLATFRRQRLAALFDRALAAEAPVDPAAVRAYYDQHQARIRTRVHVWQMLFRDPAKAQAAAAELAAGKDFAEVARAAMAAPEGQRPWDVGELAWNQVPEAWAPVLPSLAVGASSGVIVGPGGRWWIIHLVDRRDDPAQTFDHARPAIELALGADAAAAARAAIMARLRREARIELAPRPR